MLNKDVRCRMLLWIRRRIGLGDTIGKPTQGYRPNVSRVAAFEYFFVTWFMYVLMITIIDPRLFGLHHPVTYTLSTLVCAWGLYLLYKCTQTAGSGPGDPLRHRRRGSGLVHSRDPGLLPGAV